MKCSTFLLFLSRYLPLYSHGYLFEAPKLMLLVNLLSAKVQVLDHPHWVHHLCITFNLPNIAFYSHSSVFTGNWFQDPVQISISMDAQVPYIIWYSTVGPSETKGCRRLKVLPHPNINLQMPQNPYKRSLKSWITSPLQNLSPRTQTDRLRYPSHCSPLCHHPCLSPHLKLPFCHFCLFYSIHPLGIWYTLPFSRHKVPCNS